jgi:hypothetical protein
MLFFRPMQRLSRLFWRAVDPIMNVVELAKCWAVDRLCGPFPETPPTGRSGNAVTAASPTARDPNSARIGHLANVV